MFGLGVGSNTAGCSYHLDLAWNTSHKLRITGGNLPNPQCSEIGN